jgi:hypothetical protein
LQSKALPLFFFESIQGVLEASALSIKVNSSILFCITACEPMTASGLDSKPKAPMWAAVPGCKLTRLIAT